MRIKNVTSSNLKVCLGSLPNDVIITFAKLVNPAYNIYSRTGMSEGMPISKQYALHRIVSDLVEDGYFVDFVEKIIEIDANGYRGQRFQFRKLDTLINSLVDEGYSYDNESGQFFENQNERISPNWGRLKNGDERKMTVLRLDIASNSELVKNNTRSEVEKAYKDVRDIVRNSVTSRYGRLWSWEGDGALAVFHFGQMEKLVLYAGMEILHELFFYNRMYNPLKNPINIRLAAHSGQIRYHNEESERLKNEAVKEAMVYEGLAAANSLSASYNIYITMDQSISNLFSPEKSGKNRKYRLYTMGIEK